jgi:hypothetical protein
VTTFADSAIDQRKPDFDGLSAALAPRLGTCFERTGWRQARVSDKLVSPPPLASSAGNGVTRAELLLSGNGAQALVDSVAAWVGHALRRSRVCALGGRERALAAAGPARRDGPGAAEALARAAQSGDLEPVDAHGMAWALNADRRLLGVLSVAVAGAPGAEFKAQMADAARLLAQRLPGGA